ncbi:MAG: hypothetical protein Q7T55_07745 [Solirubrobacteraceae bacterium]|nr:hypothetical protein [Solirubrobacteraceae bacterium]
MLELGFDGPAIHRRLGRTLFEFGPTVYAVGHLGISRRGRGIGALLHAGDEAALSHDSAARIWGLVENPGEGPVHVSVMNRSDIADMTGVVIHRPRNLTAEEIVGHRGFRVTTPERTVTDHMRTKTVAELTRMLELMVTTLNRSPDDLHRWSRELGTLAGKAKLHRAMDEIAGPAVIRSEFETLFRSVCQEGGLPGALTNYRMGRWELDAAWIELKVAVELDSYKFHGGRWAFHRDRRKGVALSRMGFELVRLSWPQLKHDPAAVIDAISNALERGRLRRLGAAAAAAGLAL